MIMLMYLIKSGACLGILFLFYKLFLEKENMHVFKRFYLLASLLFALIVPVLVFIEYVEVPLTISTTTSTATGSTDVVHVPQALKADVLDVAPVLWSVYIIGLFFFGFKFFGNLYQIVRRIRSNPKYRLPRFTQVLLQENLIPHTFFSYIFLNKRKLEANEIPKEVLLHEETHVYQKHSWDVVFVELLQVIFWVNPLIYLTKKAIKLNHEFLADQAVLKKDINPTTYQNTLLSYLSPDSEKKYQPSLANAINYSSYSSIKKRFIIMKTRTSRKSVFIKNLLLIPLLALLLYGFSETKIETISPSPLVTTANIDHPEKMVEGTLLILISNKGEIIIEDQKISRAAIEENLNRIIQQDAIKQALIFTDYQTPIEVVEAVNTMLGQLELTQINIVGPGYQNDSGFHQNGATKTELATFNSLAKNYNKQPKVARTIPLKDLKVLEVIFRKMTDTQRKDAERFPECDVQKNQEGATKKQIREYNALAKKYNRQLSEEKNIRIYKKEVERLEYLYALMTTEQKENAEPFPDFPEPPPPPKAPKAPKVKTGEQSAVPPSADAPKAPKAKERERSAIPPPPKTPKPTSTPDKSEKEFAEEAVEEIIANQDPYDFVTIPLATGYFSNSGLNLSGSEEIQHNSAMQKINKRQELSEHHYIPKPSEPPVPKSPLDHVIEMAKKGAVFYYEGGKISSDEVIAILKKNKSINIETRGSTGNKPVVKLSTAPITVD